MLINENMFKEVYVLSFKGNTVVKGRVIATEISENGYIMHTVKTDKAYLHVDNAIVFADVHEAEKALYKWKPINDEIIRIMDSSNNAIDRLRETINGKPHFPEYAQELEGKQNV